MSMLRSLIPLLLGASTSSSSCSLVGEAGLAELIKDNQPLPRRPIDESLVTRAGASRAEAPVELFPLTPEAARDDHEEEA
jgi:hypothetical protein